MENSKSTKGREIAFYPVICGSRDDGADYGLENSQNSVALASTVSVENSSDVYLGPLTQFHGPVTIYQNVQPDSRSLEKFHASDDKPKAKIVPDGPPQKKISKLPLIKFGRITTLVSVVIAIMITIIITTTTLILTSPSIDETGFENQSSQTPEFQTPSVCTHNIYTKKQWGGRPSLNFTRPLHHPTKYVLISHTAGVLCKHLLQCSEALREMQALHVSKYGSPDIGYNFLIGGDGNIYVGRGWDTRNFHYDNNIGISFMGNFIYDMLSPQMVSALKELLNIGVQLKKLPPDYKLVCHNQTSENLSPGNNVYNEISKFPNFYPGFVVIDG